MRVIVAILVVGVLAFGVFLALDGNAPAIYYRLIDDHTLVVGAQTGPSIWTRVSQVQEDQTKVTVTVKSVRMPFVASTNDDITEVMVSLSSALGNRTVYDGVFGDPIPLRP